MIVSVAVFFGLVVYQNLSVWKYAAATPGALTLRSAGTMVFHGVAPLFAVAAGCALAWGVGRRLLGLGDGRFAREGGAPAELSAFGLGLGALATAMFLAGLLGQLHSTGILLLALAGALFSRSEFLHLPPIRMGFWMKTPLPQGMLIGLTAFAVFNALIGALAPPTGWDVTAYHLALPKLYLRSEAIREIPWLLHSHWPHLMEVLYAAPLSAGMDQAAALLHAAVFAAFVAAVFYIGRREASGTAAWLAVGLLVCSPTATRIAPMAHSDGAFAFYWFLSSWCVWLWQSGKGRGMLIVGGVLGGFAAASKLLGLYPVLTLALWVAYHVRGVKGSGRALPLLYLACAVAVAGPWYLKAWIGSGNPVWPFFSFILGGKFGAYAIEDAYIASNQWSWPPLNAAMLRYGPHFLLLPAGLLSALAFARGYSLPRFVRFQLVQAAAFLPLVFRHSEFWRFFLPFYPAFALTAGGAAAHLLGGWSRRSAAAVLCILFGLLPILKVDQNNALFAVLGVQSRQEPSRDARVLYLERSLDYYRFYHEVNVLLGPRDKVLLFREIRGYYLEVDYMWGDPLNQGLIRYSDLAGPEQLYASLRGLGVTHVLINKGLIMYRPGAGHYDKRTDDLMEGMLARRGRPILSRDSLILYRLDKTGVRR